MAVSLSPIYSPPLPHIQQAYPLSLPSPKVRSPMLAIMPWLRCPKISPQLISHPRPVRAIPSSPWGQIAHCLGKRRDLSLTYFTVAPHMLLQPSRRSQRRRNHSERVLRPSARTHNEAVHNPHRLLNYQNPLQPLNMPPIVLSVRPHPQPLSVLTPRPLLCNPPR